MLSKLIGFLTTIGAALHRARLPLAFIVSCLGSYLIIIKSDDWIEDPLGGALSGDIVPLKDVHSQSAALIINSFLEINLTVCVGLFFAAGFAFQRYHTLGRSPSSLAIFTLCLFGSSAILSFFFAARVKSAFLLQMQFDKINLLLFQSILNLHYLFLLIATICGLLLVFMAITIKPTDSKEIV